MSSDFSSDAGPGSEEIHEPESKTGSEATTPAPLEPRLDITTLKSEILTSGMEVGGTAALSDSVCSLIGSYIAANNKAITMRRM